MKRDKLLVAFKPSAKTITVHYEDQESPQWISIGVESFSVRGDFPAAGHIEVVTKPQWSYVADDRHFGLVKPDFSPDELYEARLLPIDIREKYWYVLRGELHHRPKVRNEAEALANLSAHDIAYEVHDALRWGFLNLEERRRPSRREIISRLREAGCICTESPISATPIRVLYEGDVERRIREVVSNPYFENWGMDGSRTKVDLWDWAGD